MRRRLYSKRKVKKIRTGFYSVHSWGIFTHCMVSYFSCCRCRLLAFFFQNIFLNLTIFQEHCQTVDPDQDRRFVGPELGPISLQMLLANDKSRP